MKLNPYFGRFGGQFVPEILIPALDQLEEAFIAAKDDPTFQQELHTLLTDYAGRPTPLTKCRNLTQGTKTTIYLKREDLVHGGAHKTNQVLGQALLARRMGKTRIIAETGAGQHGVATAIACALLGFKCRVYMGAKDVERQKPNVFRMELMGAEVVPVHNGRSTLKEACNAALRDWAGSFADTHYMLGTAAGPHPFPTIVREFQKIIGEEARAQFAKLEGGLPDAVIACVGGGSNAIGLFTDFVPHKSVKLIGVEPAGRGLDTPDHGATLEKGTPGIFFGARSYNMQTPDGQIEESFSISAGLDFPSVGPEHASCRKSAGLNITASQTVRHCPPSLNSPSAKALFPLWKALTHSPMPSSWHVKILNASKNLSSISPAAAIRISFRSRSVWKTRDFL